MTYWQPLMNLGGQVSGDGVASMQFGARRLSSAGNGSHALQK